MAETGRWNGHIFEVSPSLIRGYTDLTIKGGSDIKEKTSSKEKYVTRENAKAVEVTLTAVLNSMTGSSVRADAESFLSDATKGASDYFYIGDKKLVTCQLMLTDANIEQIDIGPSGKWNSASVKLTFKQASKLDGSGKSSSSHSSSSSSKKSKKASTKTSSTKKTSIIKKTAAAAKVAIKVTNAIKSVTKTKTTAERVSATKKKKTATKYSKTTKKSTKKK